MSHPYVISEDVGVLLECWAKLTGFILPSPDILAGVRGRLAELLCKIFLDVQVVPQQELVEELPSLVVKAGLPAVSMDGVYYHSDLQLQTTRAVDDEGMDVGVVPRYGTPTLDEQVATIKSTGVKEVVLVDDVIFTGHQTSEMIDMLSGQGISTPIVCVGITVGGGYDYLYSHHKVEIERVRHFPEVVDEVCERDFFPGVLCSGRYIAGSHNVGMPYLLPFGHPGKWASIPKKWQIAYSRKCCELTIELFQAIEQASGRVVKCVDLGRYVHGLPQDETRFVDALRLVTR